MITNIIKIPNISEFVGSIPAGYNLVVFEHGSDPLDGYVLLGFDEVGLFTSEFKTPAYAFVGGCL